MNELIKAIEAEQLKSDIPNFGAGDTVRVHVRIIEGKRERIQVFEGVVIRDRVEELEKLSQLEKYLSVLVLKELSQLTLQRLKRSKLLDSVR